MWVRDKTTGQAKFVIDPAEAFAMLDSGEATAIDALPARPEPADEKGPAKQAKSKAKK